MIQPTPEQRVETAVEADLLRYFQIRPEEVSEDHLRRLRSVLPPDALSKEMDKVFVAHLGLMGNAGQFFSVHRTDDGAFHWLVEQAAAFGVHVPTWIENYRDLLQSGLLDVDLIDRYSISHMRVEN